MTHQRAGHVRGWKLGTEKLRVEEAGAVCWTGERPRRFPQVLGADGWCALLGRYESDGLVRVMCIERRDGMSERESMKGFLEASSWP